MLDTSLGRYLESGVQKFAKSLPGMASFEKSSHCDGEV